jgi:hypothetical protein
VCSAGNGSHAKPSKQHSELLVLWGCFLFITYVVVAQHNTTSVWLSLASLCSAGKGSRAKPSKQPAEPLVLWGYELSPFVVVVKETLSELELPYKQVGHVCSSGGRLNFTCRVCTLVLWGTGLL